MKFLCAIHAPLDALFALLRRRPLELADIESVRVGMARRSVYVVGEPQAKRRNPQNVVDGQFSTHFCLATGIKLKRFGWDDYEGALADPEIRAFLPRVDVYEDAECERLFPRCFSAVVELRLRDGSELREFVLQPRGEPETMLSLAELREKFAQLVRPRLGAEGEARLFDRIARLHEGDAVGELLDAARPRSA